MERQQGYLPPSFPTRAQTSLRSLKSKQTKKHGTWRAIIVVMANLAFLGTERVRSRDSWGHAQETAGDASIRVQPLEVLVGQILTLEFHNAAPYKWFTGERRFIVVPSPGAPQRRAAIRHPWVRLSLELLISLSSSLYIRMSTWTSCVMYKSNLKCHHLVKDHLLLMGIILYSVTKTFIRNLF